MPSATALAYGFSTVLLLFLGGLILWREPKSRLNRLFALFTLFMVAWLDSLYLYYHLHDAALLTPVGRFNFAAIEAAVACGYFFTVELIGLKDRFRRWEVTETVVLIVLTAFTPLVSARELQTASGVLETHFGILFAVFVLHLVGYIGAAALFLILNSKRAPSERRAQLRLILWGFLVTACVAITTNIALPVGFGYFGLQEAGALSVIFLIAAFAYAILFQRLFDIRIIVKRTVIFAALIGSFIGLYGALALFAVEVLRKATVTASEFLFNLLAVAVVGLTSEPIRRWIAARTDRWLYQKDYEQQAIVATLNQELSTTFDLDTALEMVLKALQGTLHLSHVVAYVFEPGSDGGLVQKKVQALGFHSTVKLFLHDDDGVVAYFSGNRSKKEVADFPHSSDTPSALGKLKALGIAVAVPVSQGDQLAGLLLLGSKRSGESFSRRDMAFLDLVSAPTLSAIQKAKLYEGDQNKTEFVSIAAHELLTPIAGIQGYLSMVLDENIGQVDSQARNYLDKVYASSKRLGALVRDLLSVSRMESGRVKIELRMLDVGPFLRDALDQVAPTVSGKDLTLSIEPIAAPLQAFADPDRLMEVLVNLIGNAVKYTLKGSVTISAAIDDAFVKIEIRDTGLGMSPEAQKRLFEKFYRVKTAETQRIAGTGLGLFVTKSMIEKMGGAITVTSTPGVGSVFAFTLPGQSPE